MKRITHVTFLTALLIFSCASTALATTFSTADFSGNWRGYWMETTNDGDLDFTDEARYWLGVSAEIDGNGAFGTGTWTSSGGLHGNVTGGTLAITSAGSITGTLNINYAANGATESISIVHGWMDQSKEIVYLAFKKANGRVASGMMTKYALSGFNTSMLEGEWENILVETDPASDHATYWVEAELGVNSAGTGVGAWNYQGIQSGLIHASPLTLNTYGVLGGTMNLDSGDSVTINLGQLDLQRNCGSLVTTKATGELSGGIMIRTGGTGFATSDLEGTWAIYRTATYSEQQMLWIAGEATFDASGNLTGGTWVGSNDTPGTYTGGNIAVAANGKLSGTYQTSAGRTLTIDSGFMGITKTYAAMASRQNSALEAVFMIKKVSNGSAYPAINLLLN